MKVNTGVIFTGESKIAEHGGLNEDDTHAALLVSLAGLEQKTVKTPVLNQQVAPSIIKALGFGPNQLEADRAFDTGGMGTGFTVPVPTSGELFLEPGNSESQE